MKRNVNVDRFGIVLALSLFLPNLSFAQDAASTSPYSSSGNCSIQGSWTRAALSQTQEIKQVITKLKDNPACNGLKNSMEANLTAMEGALRQAESAQAQQGHGRTLSQLPEDISALRTFSRNQSPFKSNVMNLLVGKTVQMSALSSSTEGDGGAASMAALSARAREAASTGLQLFNNTMSSFQEAHQGCLESGPTAAVIASGMVKILNSFAASNSGLNNQIALSVQKVSQYLARDKKYVDALRSLNDAEFISSMSCLIQITTNSYCDALDAQYLFEELNNNQNVKVETVRNEKTGVTTQRIVGVNKDMESRLAKGSLSGYYVLTRQVPVVTEWLQKVQLGVKTQLPSQSEFKITVSATVQNHNNVMTRIEGTFNYNRNTLKSMRDPNAKQGQALKMLQDIAGEMIGLPTQTYENFFKKSFTDSEIYFRLLGVPVPEQVAKDVLLNSDPMAWLRTNFRSMPVFGDPDKLADLVEQNMKEMFKIATKESVSFYNQNFVVDRPQVVGDSLLGLNSNVRDALINIKNYLVAAEKRMADEKDTSYLPLAQNTRERIEKILARYKDLYRYSQDVLKMRTGDANTPKISQAEMEEKLKKVAIDLLDEVYLQFDMQTALTGMLANRLSGIVLQDYTIGLKKGNRTGTEFDDIMLVSGFVAMNNMFNMAQSDRTDIMIDLAQAISINKTNIDALEKIVTGVYVRNIFNNKIRAENENITETERNQLAYKWAYKMAEVQFPGENANMLQRRARAYLNRFWNDVSGKDAEYFGVSYLDKAAHPFKQLFNSLIGRKGNIIASPTSEFDTNQKMLGVYCTQTLAFANFTPYWALCADAVLESPLKNKANVRDPEVRKLMETYLAVPYKQKAYENLTTTKLHPKIDKTDRARNMQARICALRDYHQRNKIAEVTSTMRMNDDGESAFLKEIAEEVDKNVKK